ARRVARRVEEDVLALRLSENPADQVPRGLRPRRDDRQLLAHQAVEQARLAGVRAADQRHGAAALAQAPSASSMARAASCSARWRELPVPRALSSPTTHSTSNDWRCAAPRTEMSR